MKPLRFSFIADGVVKQPQATCSMSSPSGLERSARKLHQPVSVVCPAESEVPVFVQRRPDDPR